MASIRAFPAAKSFAAKTVPFLSIPHNAPTTDAARPQAPGCATRACLAAIRARCRLPLSEPTCRSAPGVIGMSSKPETQRRWRISLIREGAELLGFVDAPDAATAIKEAIERFSVKDEERQKRLVAVRWN